MTEERKITNPTERLEPGSYIIKVGKKCKAITVLPDNVDFAIGVSTQEGSPISLMIKLAHPPPELKEASNTFFPMPDGLTDILKYIFTTDKIVGCQYVTYICEDGVLRYPGPVELLGEDS